MRILTLLTVPGEEEMPLWRELWIYFYETYYGNNVYYPNLNMDTSDMIMVKNLILGIFIGLTIAAFGAVYNKRILGGFVRKLLKNECLSPESAKTFSQLEATRSYAIRNAVRKSVSLRRVVRCVEEEQFLEEQKKLREEYEEKRKENKSLPKFQEEKFEIDIENDHFYIPEDMKYMADVKFENKGTTWLGAILFIVIMAIAFVALLVFLPQIFELIDSFAAGFKNGGNGNIL